MVGILSNMHNVLESSEWKCCHIAL